MDQNNSTYTAEDVYAFAPRNAAFYRTRARETMKKNLGIIVLASFLASLLISGLGGAISSVLSNVTVLFGSIPAVALTMGAIASVATVLLPLLIGGPVAVGYEKFRLDAIDGKPLKLDALFAAFRTCFGKSVLAQVVYFLISLVAAIPTILPAGFIVVTLFGAGVWESMPQSFADPTAAALPTIPEEIVPVLGLGFLLLLAGSILTMLLQLVIYYRYVFAVTILAEFPETSVTDAFRNSASMMKGRKWKLFCLDCSFMGWVLLTLLAGCCTCGLGAVVAILFLAPYCEHAHTAFYDDVANRAAAREAVFPSLNPDDYTVE